MKRRNPFWVALVLTVGSLCATGIDGGCWNVGTNSLMTSIRPCAIFDCTQGFLFGAIDPCGQPGNALDDIFVGCP